MFFFHIYDYISQGKTRVQTGVHESRDTYGLRDSHGLPHATEEDATV